MEVESVYFKFEDLSEEVTSELGHERCEKTPGDLGLGIPSRGNTKCKKT